MTGMEILVLLGIFVPYLLLLPLKWLVIRNNYIKTMENPSFVKNYLTDDFGDFLIWIPLLNYVDFIGLVIFWDREKFGFTSPDPKQPSKLTQLIFLLPKPMVPVEDKEKMGRISIKQ